MGMFGAAVVVILIASAAAAQPFDSVLATGDFIPGLGTVGSGSFRPLTVQDDGRMVFYAALSDGRSGIFRASSASVEAVWTSAADDVERIDARSIVIHNDGQGVFLTQWPERSRAYRIDPDGVRLIARAGDPGPPGMAICDIERGFRSVSGEVALLLSAADDCQDYDRWRGYWRVGSNWYAVEEVAPSFLAAGFDADGMLRVVSAEAPVRNQGLLGIRLVGPPAGLVDLVAQGWRVDRATMNGHGELGLYLQGRYDPLDPAFATAVDREVIARSQGDQLQIIHERQDGLLQLLSDYDDQLSMNDAGTIAYSIADGGPALVLSSKAEEIDSIDGAGRIGERGELPVKYRANSPFPGPEMVGVRYADGVVLNRVSAGQQAPGGGVFAAGGIGDALCLSASGLVASVVDTVDGRQGLVCIDEIGAHLVIERGSRAASDSPLDRITECRFGADDSLYFATGDRSCGRGACRNLFRATRDWIVPAADWPALAARPELDQDELRRQHPEIGLGYAALEASDGRLLARSDRRSRSRLMTNFATEARCELAPPVTSYPSRTPTPAPTRTPTVTRTRRPSSTPTPSKTATAVADDCAGPSGCIRLQLSARTDDDELEVRVGIAGGGANIVAIQLDLEIAGVESAAVCRVVAPVPAPLRYFTLPETGCATGRCTKLRALLVDVEQPASLVAGPLFRCRFALDDAARDGGRHSIRATRVIGSTRDGRRIDGGAAPIRWYARAARSAR